MGSHGEICAHKEGSRRVIPEAERPARLWCDGRDRGLVRVGVRGVRHGPSPPRRAAGNAKSEPTRPVLLAMVSLVALRRRYRPEALLRSDGRPPALLRVATPLWLESIKGPRDVNKNVVGSQGRGARVESTWLVNRDVGTACAQDR